jgi:anaerobic ribonucleoside-triphosphate reductase activating protein
MDLGVLGDFRQDLFVKDQIPASSNQYIYDFKQRKKLDSIIKEE